jgi:Mitochondrial carrier protein
VSLLNSGASPFPCPCACSCSLLFYCAELIRRRCIVYLEVARWKLEQLNSTRYSLYTLPLFAYFSTLICALCVVETMKVVCIAHLHLLVLFISASISQCLAVDYRYFVAGGVCAAYSHGITTPIDVIKTKMQADPTEYNDGMLSAAAKIIKKDGPGVLLGGLGPTVVGYGIEGAAKFGIYEILKPIFGQVIEDQPTAFILASIAAGAVAALILCPAESVRIRIVTDKDYADKGLLSGLPKLIKDEGFLEMFGGFPAMLTKQVRQTSNS